MDDDVVTAAWAAAQLVAEEHPGARVLALGSEAYREEHRLAGLVRGRRPGGGRGRVLGGDLDVLATATCATAVRGVLRGAALLRLQPRPHVPGPRAARRPPRVAPIAAVEYATDTNARCAGKPERAMFDEARRLLGEGRYLMVGDRLDADVAGGAAARDGHGARADGVGHAARTSTRWTGARPTHVLGSLRRAAGDHL